MKEQMSKIIEEINKVISYYEENNNTNSQTLISFLDEINALSVKY